MTAIDWQKLKEDAAETLAMIDTSNLKASSYAALGASIAILDHKADTVDTQQGTRASELAAHLASVQSTTIESLSDELRDSEKYYDLWRSTGLKDYKKLSEDEAHHYEVLVRLARMENPNVDLGETMLWHDALLAKLG